MKAFYFESFHYRQLFHPQNSHNIASIGATGAFMKQKSPRTEIRGLF
jgi:hypothetical protein